MGLDLERLRNKLDRLKNPSKTKFSRNTWRPKKDGEESVVRLIEYPYGDDPFVELWFHYGIGKGPGILCPRIPDGKTCPICEFAESERDHEHAKKLWPKQRIFAVTIDRADGKPTPRYWGFGKQVYQKLIESLLNDEYSHYLDVMNGIDMTVITTQPEGQAYPKTDFTFSRKDSPLAASEADIQEIMNSVKPIDEVFKQSTTAEIQERLTAWLSFTEEEAEKESTETKRGGAAETAKAPVDTSMEKIDEDFEKALATGNSL